MSDSKVRELERQWRRTGSPDDEASYLAERLRTGGLVRERVELAAYVGSEAAAPLTSSPATELKLPPGEVSWRFGLAVALEIIPVWENASIFWDDTTMGEPPEGAREVPRQALGKLREWLDCPCPTHAASLEEARERTHAAWKWVADHWGFGELEIWEPCYFVLYLISLARGEAELEDLQPVLEVRVREALQEELADVLRRETVRAELIPWLLGHTATSDAMRRPGSDSASSP